MEVSPALLVSELRHKLIYSRRHVFTDLAPYICTFADCKLGLASFATRKSWADHEFSIHRVLRLWSCKDCGSEFSDREKYRNHAKWNHSPVFTRGQLELLVNSAEKHVGAVLNDKCPFCFELPGSKVRNFSMHVAKHMEEIALAVLPRDTEFEADRTSLSSKGSMSSQSPSVPAKGDGPQKQEPVTTSALEAFEGKRHASLDDLTPLATIGRENYSKTLLAEGKISKCLYAVKIVKKELLIENDEVAQVKAEKETLIVAAQEKHPFIVQIRSTFQTETRVYFVFDHMSGGDLMFHIQKGMRNGKKFLVLFITVGSQLAIPWTALV